MAKNFNKLFSKLPNESQQYVNDKVEEISKAMPLQALRMSRNITQEQLAYALKIKQSSVSKMERRDDMNISTLNNLINAMGGKLEITAKFNDGNIVIDNLKCCEKALRPYGLK